MVQVLALGLAPALTFAVVLRLIEWLRGWREVRFSVTAWLGLIGYALYIVLLESYRIGGFAALLSIISGHKMLSNPLAWLIAFVGLLAVSVPMSWPASQKIAEFILALCIFGLILECYVRLPKGDAMGRGIWAVTLVAGISTVLEIMVCQTMLGLTLPREYGSACGQVLSELLSWFPTIALTLAMGLVIFNHDRLERA